MYTNNGDNHYSNLKVNLKKIERYIQVFQKQIYIASQNCAIDTVRKYQNNFFIQKDFHLVFIQKIILMFKKIISFTNTYYKKLLIVMYFIIYKQNIIKYYGLKLIKNKITQYAFFLLIKPEWEARHESSTNIYQNRQYVQIIKSHMTVLLDTYSSYKNVYGLKITTQTNCKHINNQKIIQKLDNSNYISDILDKWLNEQNYINECISIKYLKKLTNYENYFYDLLDSIVYTGLKWHIYLNLRTQSMYSKIFIDKQNNYLYFLSTRLIMNIMIKNIANFLDLINMNLKSIKCITYKYYNYFISLDNIDIIIKNKSNLIVQVSQQSIRSISHTIKCKLYHKNEQGYWRANSCLNSTQAIFFIREILSEWYKYYHNIISNQEVISLNNTIDKIFYAWQVKK